MGYDLFSVQEPGQPQSWQYPSLNPDLTWTWEPIDGTVRGPFLATAISEMIKDDRKDKWVKECGLEDVQIYCYITESRFVFVCPNYDKGGGWVGVGLGLPAAMIANAVSEHRAANRTRGTALTGHIRYPWVWLIQFWQKAGWASNETIRLYYTDPDGPNRYVEIVLDKTVDAAQVAFDVRGRVLAYRLCDRDPKDDAARAAFQAALSAGPVAAVRGQLAEYDIPHDHFVAPGGEKFAPLYAPSSGQNVPPPPPAPEPPQPPKKKWHGIVSTLEPNEPVDWSWPTINDDLGIRFDALDGHIIGPLPATCITNYLIFDKGGRPSFERDCWVSGDQIVVYITESRLVYVRPEPAAPGAPRTARAGQLRYPWVCRLEFQAKQNWLTNEELRLFYEDDSLQVLEVTLHKSQSAAALAPVLLQRIAAYQLAAGTPKDPRAVAELQAMTATRALPPPRDKYDYTGVDLPVYSALGTGQELAPSGPPSQLPR
ncbi:hypothetical protein [Mycolicibacterium sp.]|uniref:hypothetical protein n=1 Tax=Mycolicibacterium sp. TaxID=2320850 RepID=UPI003D10A36F